MNKDINEVEFTIFDTETTGLDFSGGDRVIEIAGMRFKGDRILSSFQSLINPLRPVSEAAYMVNKISADMLKDAPLIKEVMPKFLDFAKGSCLCSYNAAFDFEFMNNEIKIIGDGSLDDFIVVDILKMARRLMPSQERYALWFIAQKLGFSTQQKHRALSDVELTLAVFNKLKEMLIVKGVIEFEHFVNMFSINKSILDNLNAKKIAQIQQAIDMGVELNIKYVSSSGGEVSERKVSPKEIKQEGGYSYFTGYCHLRKDERVFRIDGILHIEVV